MSQRLSDLSTPSTYTEEKKRDGSEKGITGGVRRLASIRRAAKWQGCCGLACTFVAAPAKTPGILVGELEMMSQPKAWKTG